MSSFVHAISPRRTASASMRGCTLNWDRTSTGANGAVGCRGGRAGGVRGRRGAPFFTRRMKSITSGVRGW